MRFNGMSGLAAHAKRLGDRVQLTIGHMAFTLDPDEAIKLADRLVDCTEATRHRQENHR
ncbi:hypothetical protein MINTM001_24780 [Mycobacterium paraintracellulare]|uniref:hypothetical protein n=1 Tax=Mycobacterium paraintracellulare TaxID=1138383 RepID=UPI0019276218|nr:hypothetical protein [Mycobacterium paraintracellulare]BCO41339.1 hypothetical protein MINTM001_24780 [Mycobacterium paraintracellulare]